MKEVVFIGASKRRLKEFPEAARVDAGHQLWQLQLGRDPDDWRIMAGVGPGAREIRIHKPGEYRVMYVAQFAEAIYVLHAFGKKTQQTTQHDINVARAAYAEAKERHQKEKQR